MRPFIRDGEILPIREAPASLLRPGDIALYEAGDRRMLHRVWWRRPGMVWFKDDTGTVSLHKIPDRRVLGVLESGGPLSRGWTGLVYGLGATVVFTVGRWIKRRVAGWSSPRGEP